MSSADIIALLKCEGLPTLDDNKRLICLILNVIPGIAGVGTIFAGVSTQNNNLIIVGVLEWVFQFLFIGYLHSIYLGWKLYSPTAQYSSV
ncbi:hypothetical protein KIPB_007607 [Kipferlia bialata]|uniref:Uncharacterized protein n=1 Tax=Kipferlia bialata TaxID=797122 RepID=A0A9K3D0A2_9EUKA|nr:hypothetical protein KIPB_007607 [Kipferlia bialata]|eukprot:g7607.t1